MKFSWEYLLSWKGVRNKENKCYKDFLIRGTKVPLVGKVLLRFSKSHKLIISLLH